VQPSPARHRVAIFGMSLAVLSYVDRTVIAQAAPIISSELGFDKVMMGTLLSAFLLGYGLFEIAGRDAATSPESPAACPSRRCSWR